MTQKLHQTVGLVVAILSMTASLHSMKPQEASLPAADKAKAERILFQPLSLAHSCLLQLSTEELERLPLATLPEHIQALLGIVIQHSFSKEAVDRISELQQQSTQTAHDMFLHETRLTMLLTGISLFREKKISTRDLEILVHIYSGRKSDLHDLDPNDALLPIIIRKGNLNAALDELQSSIHLGSVEDFLRRLEFLFKLGLSGKAYKTSYCSTTNNVTGEKFTKYTYSPWLRELVLASCAALTPAKKSAIFHFMKLLLKHGADPNNCWTTNDHVNRSNKSESPLLFTYCTDAPFATINLDIVALLLDYGYNLNALFEGSRGIDEVLNGKTIIQALEYQISKLKQEAQAPVHLQFYLGADDPTPNEKLEKAQSLLNFLNDYKEKQELQRMIPARITIMLVLGRKGVGLPRDITRLIAKLWQL